MRSGKKNALVTINRQVETGRADSYNTPIMQWEPFIEDVFCYIVDRRGKELVVEGQIVAETYTRFDFEFLDVEGIDATMQIVHECREYDIRAIVGDQADRDWVSVDCVYKPRPVTAET